MDITKSTEMTLKASGSEDDREEISYKKIESINIGIVPPSYNQNPFGKGLFAKDHITEFNSPIRSLRPIEKIHRTPLRVVDNQYDNASKTSSLSRVANISSDGKTPQSQPTQQSSPYIPLAERLNKIERQIPDRFRVKPVPRPAPSAPISITQPRSPRLRTSIRAGAYLYKPSSPRPTTFKARPLNPKVINSNGELGVPKIKKIPGTVPQTFKFSEPRVRTRPQIRVVSPQRVRSAKKMRTFLHSKSISALRQPTVPRPFTFASDRLAEKKKYEQEAKRRKIEEDKEKEKFKAQPMPKFNQVRLPRIENRPLTRPEPFRFSTDQRIEVHKAFNKGSFAENHKKSLFVPFKARPLPKFTSPPTVRKSAKPLTKPKPIPLKTDERSEKRRKYDSYILQKWHEQERREKFDKEYQKEQEEAEIRRLRKSIAFKARPMPKFNFFHPKPSVKPLTDPKTPPYGKRKRF